MLRKILLPFLLAAALVQTARAEPDANGLPAFNDVVLRMVNSMPADGGYSVTSGASRLLAESISLVPGGLHVTPEHARPSYCSGATYLVFVRTVQELMRQGRLNLDAAALKSLLARGQRDGEGVWGRWNANGPGTARLFHELGLGRNFTDWDQARPGDFMKIFWSDEIGKLERGHSVVFLGTQTEAGVEYVRFWSSNQPRGFHEKRVPRSKVIMALFSRLERPAALAEAPALPKIDSYLASLLSTRSSLPELRKKCGL